MAGPGTNADPGGVRVGEDGLARCPWPGDDPLYVAYHDHEWARPVTDERALFEKMVLEGFQAGLSWLVILRKRDAFRAAFRGFDPEAMAAFTADDVAACRHNPAIVRNGAKIEAAVANARALLQLWDAGRCLTDLIWSHGPPSRPRPASMAAVPSSNSASQALAASLRAAGFAFVGPTSCYALMQAMGLVDDHLAGCHVPPEDCGPAAVSR